MKDVSDKFVEKIKTHFSSSVTFFRKPCLLWDHAEKFCRAGQATDDNMAHAHCMLHTKGYKHTLTIRNTYCFSTAAVVARTRDNVTLLVAISPAATFPHQHHPRSYHD